MILLKDLWGAVDLQATLKSSTVPGIVTEPVHPHHPITCGTKLRLERNRTFSCEHATAPASDHVAGSGIEFDNRGRHVLKGIPGTWQLFAIRT